jgi:hypothetical protein
VQDTQALEQVHGDLLEQYSTIEWKKFALQAKWDEEKVQLHKEKEQLLIEKLEVKERVNIALLSMIVIEVKSKERFPQ